MRRVTRNFVLLVLAVLVALLALGALPALLGSGDPYYVTAEPVGAADATGNGSANGTATGGEIDASAAVNGSALSERQFPYTTTALRNGTSEPYRKGPWGLKEAFTHSPFDEIGALSARNPNATAAVERGVLVSYNGTLYRVAAGQRI